MKMIWKALKAHKEFKVLKAYKEYKVLKVQKAQQVRQAPVQSVILLQIMMVLVLHVVGVGVEQVAKH